VLPLLSIEGYIASATLVVQGLVKKDLFKH